MNTDSIPYGPAASSETVQAPASKSELTANIRAARLALKAAEQALVEWSDKAENNVYTDLDEAIAYVEEALLSRAAADCEGSYNCGDATYTREFIIDGVTYIGTLTCEYNRHDKTYYYVDGSEFKWVTKSLTPSDSAS